MEKQEKFKMRFEFLIECAKNYVSDTLKENSLACLSLKNGLEELVDLANLVTEKSLK